MASALPSSRDIKDIIIEFDELDEQLQKIRVFCDQLKQEISTRCERINGQTRASFDMVPYIINHDNSYLNQPEVQDFVQALVSYADYAKIAGPCIRYEQEFGKEIDDCLKQIETVASPFRRLFLNNTQKEQAEAAYKRLTEIQDVRYPDAIDSAYAAMKTKRDKQQAFQALSDHPDQYLSVLIGLGTDLHIPQSHPAENIMSAVRTQVGQVKSATTAITRQLTLLEQSIVKQAQLIAAKEALTRLQEMDIEQLSKVKSGLRMKSLRDAGFTNIAKIYTASVYQLASINGITPETASLIKSAATDLLNEIQTAFRLKISSDNKNPETGKLLCFTYQLLQTRQRKQELTQYQAATIDSAVSAMQRIAQFNCNAVLIVSPHKEAFIGAYRMLRAIPVEAPAFVKNATQYAEFTTTDAWKDFAADPVKYNTVLQGIIPEFFGTADTMYGLPEELAKEIQDQKYFPEGLLVTLRPYQEWGVKYILHQKRIILGDEMGLGKTVQAIATMVSLKYTGAKCFLVICPAGVLPNWCKEIEQKSVFHPIRIYGATRDVAFRDWLKHGGVAVTTYETACQIRMETGSRFDLLVVDEAHYIKNPNALRSKATIAITSHTDRVLFLTGTPLENKVEEMITLIKILNPTLASQIQSLTYLSTAPTFREKIAPVYYRRKREDVLTELPGKEELDTWVDLLPEERKLYRQAVLAKDITAIRRVSWTIQDARLSAKAQRLKEIVHEAAGEDRRVIVFSFYKDTLRMIRQFLGACCAGVIDGSVPAELRQQMIDRFKDMPGGSVLLLQINAGGTGLNIQSASVVIICEPQLKPSIEDQAISRAFRMNQDKKVLVYRLLADKTIDERITNLLEKKRKAFLAFADTSAAAEMTKELEKGIEPKTLGNIIQEEIDRINMENGVEPDEVVWTPEDPDMDTDVEDITDETHDEVPVAAEADVPETDTDETDVAEADVAETDTDEAGGAEADVKETDAGRTDVAETKRAAVGIKSSDAAVSGEKTGKETVQLSVFDLPESKEADLSPTFDSIDSFIRYINDEEMTYVDNRAKNGCLWILSDDTTDSWIKSVKIANKKLQYSPSAKVLSRRPGWFIS